MTERTEINLGSLEGTISGLDRNKHNISPYEQELPDKIKVVIRALGTMVIVPDYEKDSLDIGAKTHYKGGIQQPILEGKDRAVVVNKLVELINQL